MSLAVEGRRTVAEPLPLQASRDWVYLQTGLRGGEDDMGASPRCPRERSLPQFHATGGEPSVREEK